MNQSIPRPAEQCRTCGGKCWWMGSEGYWVCESCSPPHDEKQVIMRARLEGHYYATKHHAITITENTPPKFWPEGIGAGGGELVEEAVNWAKQALRVLHLPATAWVWEESGREAPDPHELPKRSKVQALTLYLKEKGHKPDTEPMVAASILWHEWRLRTNANGENEYLEEGFRIGHLFGRAYVQFGRARQQQKNKGRKGAKTRWGGKPDIVNEVIKDLAYREGDPRELWNHFWSALDHLELHPRETIVDEEIRYSWQGTQHVYTYHAFRKAIQRARSERSK